MRHPDVIESLQIKEEILAEKEDRIKQLEARIIKMQTDWNSDVGRLTREVERLGEIVTEHDGIECTKHDMLLRGAVKEEARLRKALAFYGNPKNWQFTHDKEGNLLWVTSIGPDYAMEILQGEKPCTVITVI